jgi:hypothetical protein
VGAATIGSSGEATAAPLKPIMPARCRNLIIRLGDIPGSLVHRQTLLILFPDSGHGANFPFLEEFAEAAALFLAAD